MFVGSPSGMFLPLSSLLLSLSHSGSQPPFFSPRHLYYLDFWSPRSPPHSAIYSGCGQIRLPHTTLPSGDTLLQNHQSTLISRARNILLLFCWVQCSARSFHVLVTQLPLLFAYPSWGSQSSSGSTDTRDSHLLLVSVHVCLSVWNPYFVFITYFTPIYSPRSCYVPPSGQFILLSLSHRKHFIFF